MDIDERREIEAIRRVARMTAKPTTYSVRALSLMTLGRGALQSALRYHG